MPVTPTYPGVYIEEIPSGVRTITGVATSITAFLGRALSGPINEPTTINSFGDFERGFGGLQVDYPMSYAVRDFYLNGGSQAIIVRLYVPPAADADGRARFAVDGLTFVAASAGKWGGSLRVMLDANTPDELRAQLNLKVDDAFFNLTVMGPNGVSEKFKNLTVVNGPQRIDKVLKDGSNLIQWDGAFPDAVPAVPKVKAAATAQVALAAAQKKLRDALAANPQVPADIAAAQAALDAATKDLDTKNKDLRDGASKAESAIADAQKKLAAALAANPQVPADIAAAQAALDAANTNLGNIIAAWKADDGKALDANAYEGDENNKTGFFALAKADLFNLLCIPPDARGSDTLPAVYQAAMAYCARRRAMLIVDSPASWSANKETAAATARDHLSDLSLSGPDARNAALFFPRVYESDPLHDGQTDVFVPCGIVTGVMARTDTARGVWKAPAGLDAALNGIQGIQVNLTDPENGMLNPLGINCLRDFKINGRVVWGARTLRGADQLADEYKYIPVRRTALYIEESLYRGTQWVVFEPNDEPLWAQIRLNVGAFMHDLFRQGAFQGQPPKDAYFVKCDKETTTQNDINLGIVNIVVGFAPLKPAEFVIIKIQQIAGEIVT